MRNAALVIILSLGTILLPSPASARHWRPYYPPPVRVFHHHAHLPGAVIGLGIAGAVLGTIAVVDSIVRPRPLIVAAPPPLPPPDPDYDDAYRRGYEDGRRDGDYGPQD